MGIPYLMPSDFVSLAIQFIPYRYHRLSCTAPPEPARPVGWDAALMRDFSGDGCRGDA